jgi:hypothetical protein
MKAHGIPIALCAVLVVLIFGILISSKLANEDRGSQRAESESPETPVTTVLPATTSAASKSERRNAISDAKTGEIHGIVRRYGQPLGNVSLTLHRFGISGQRSKMPFRSSPGITIKTTSADNGTFSLHVEKLGKYVVHAWSSELAHAESEPIELT